MNNKTRELIAEAERHIAYTLDSIGPEDSQTRKAWAAGEGSDERFALVVKLSKALEALLPGDNDQEWEYSVGHRNSDGTYSAEADFDEDELTDDLDEAREWVDEALDSGTYDNAILVKRAPKLWLPVEEVPA